MPPAAMSDSEEDHSELDVEALTKKSGRARKTKKLEGEDDVDVDESELVNGDADEDDEDDGDDGEKDGEVYTVEKIIGHTWDQPGSKKGILHLHVVWEGYPDEEDMTWEPESTLGEDAPEALEEYFESVGGRDKLEEEYKLAKSRKRGRQSTGTPSGSATSNKRAKKNSEHPLDTEPPLTAKKAWKPPIGSWEDDIEQLDACEDEVSGKLMVYLTWKNGQKTQHETKVVYRHCPQKMLQFYEQHVRIIKAKSEVPGIDVES